MEEKVKKPKMELWKKIVLIGLAIIAVLIFVIYSATSGVVKVSNEFVNDVQASNTDAAYSLFSREAAAATSKDTLKTVIDRSAPILNTQEKMTSREVSGETGKAGTGTVTYEIKGTDGKTYTLTVKLIKEDGNWKVLAFQSVVKQ